VFLFIAVTGQSSMYFKHYFAFAGFSALSPLKEIRPFVPLLFFRGDCSFFPSGIHQSGFHQRNFPMQNNLQQQSHSTA
jgi:hypothetical protein